MKSEESREMGKMEKRNRERQGQDRENGRVK